MSCPTCGAQNPEQATQCQSCGAQLVATASPSGAATWGPPSGEQPGGPQPLGSYPTSEWSNQPVATAGQLAGWWRRVGATLIDAVILGVISEVIRLATNRPIELVVGFLIGLVYTAGLLVKQGQTVGMMALRTRCIREGTQDNITVGPAVYRYVVTEILGVTIIGGLLDVLWPLWDSKNQTIHDKVAHSLVVRTS